MNTNTENATRQWLVQAEIDRLRRAAHDLTLTADNLAALLLPAPETEWRYSKDPEELAQAMQDGRQVEIRQILGVEWRPVNNRTVDGFRTALAIGRIFRIGPKAEPEWRDSKDPDELDRAVRDGRQVEWSEKGEVWWPTSLSTAASFRRSIDLLGHSYRIGPKKENT